ncbi:Hypothetical protein PHPALM_2030 [Phytophthora palmivora]|uniref:HIG1 domain-containing protein n=1 Tax=Phytophthora palmivora TaxID=4796 RepID=A0A2P4YQU5_9STRA|nr:Hypothetical protein PHPALM_2030 [Phytophthora palmivora]
MMSSIDHSASWEAANPNQRRDVISWHAYTCGLKTGATTASVMAAGVLTANKYWPAFRNRLNTTGKTALVVMPFLASFTVEAERRLVHGARNPEFYMATMDGAQVEEEKKTSKLKIWQQGAHPYQHLNKGISASQQVMHTRIYGQAAVVVLLLSSMAFHDYMAKRGKYGEEEEA